MKGRLIRCHSRFETFNRKEVNVLFHDALNTFYLRLFMASDIW